jgi:hypothetical protein
MRADTPKQGGQQNEPEINKGPAMRTLTVQSIRARRIGLLWMLAEWTGLEPATPDVTGRYSNQLNYHSKLVDLYCRS